ncbi:MAG: hypothetical protein ACW98K_01470 [Candidatus Kariarchaeaceae archaeon]|jgi:hypothetical protein
MSTSQVNSQNMHNQYAISGSDAFDGVINRIHTSLKMQEDTEIEFNVEKINRPAIKKIKSNMYTLSELANENNFQLKFSDLSGLQHRHCCVWWSGHQVHPTNDIHQLGAAIESNTKTNGSPLICINFSCHNSCM